MKVSILVPVYGVERYIEKCARSLFEQSYKDIEYVFVDDCTPDNSIEVLQSVIDSFPERAHQVRIIRHKQNKGLAGARQTALEASTGETVIIVDSDDYVDALMVESLVNEMEKSKAGIVDCGFCIVSDVEIAKELMPLNVSDNAYLKIILCQNVESHRIWGRLIKKSIFVDNDIHFYHGIDYSEDFSVLPKLLIKAKRSWVDSCFYFYRDDNPQSYTNNITTKNAISFLKAQQLVGDFMKSQPQWRDYQLAAEIGWVNVWRFARRFNVDFNLVDEHFTLRPTNVTTKCLAWLMKSRLPYGVVNFIYKAVRTIYLI